MGTPKVRIKNGFEYRARRSGYDWIYEYRPVECRIWISYIKSLDDTVLWGGSKTVKADLEKFLNDPAKSQKYYDDTLARESDVIRAEKSFKQAYEIYQRSLTDPTFDDFRGNNPNKIGRRKRDAEMQYHLWEGAVKKAQELAKIIEETCNRK